MADEITNLKKQLDVLNKYLYKKNKVTEYYKQLNEILETIDKSLKEIQNISSTYSFVEDTLEQEIKQRKLIVLFKDMTALVGSITQEMDSIYKNLDAGNDFFEQFRSYRKYVFPDTKNSKGFLKKIIGTFNIQTFILRFGVVGNIDLQAIATKIQGKKVGTYIEVPAENIDLIYDELLKTGTIGFRLICEPIIIHFEKDTQLLIEGQSKKIKACDIDAQSFKAKLLGD